MKQGAHSMSFFALLVLESDALNKHWVTSRPHENKPEEGEEDVTGRGAEAY